MFGNSKPFGASSTFGTSTFGSTSSPFGQSSTTFGAKPPGTNVFGTPAFGTTTPSTGSLFGTNTPTTGAGLFGQTTTAFGQPASTSGGTFGFGNTSTSGSLFGTNTQQTPSAGLFGSSSTSAFGTPQPTFGGFGSTSTGSGLFGQSTSTGTSLFGSTTGFNAATNGTTIKFNPTTSTDTMMKGGVSTNISTRHQCITCMKEYENKSLEELRMEDYAANRKGPQAGISGFGNTGQTGLFGAPASTSAFSFGNTQTKPLFGNTTNTFGTTGTGLFGQTPQQQSTGMFGKPVGFGTPTTTSGSTFSFGNTGGTSLFGQNNQQKPLFGQPTGGSGLFGSTATTQPSTGFGTGTGFGGFGTTPQQSTGLFGTKPTGFGTTNTTTTNTFTFGNTSNLGTGLFGQKPATVPPFGTSTAFGTPSPGFGSFGTTQTPSTGLFGQTKPSTGFGATGSTFSTGLGTGFGNSPFSMGLGTNTGAGLFGGSTANKTTGFSFGNAGSGGFSFSQPGASNPSFNFGPTTAVGMGNDPNASALIQQQLHVQQQILALATNPFGDSHLFRNAIKETNKREEVLKPTNPSAQKALLSNNQYKVSPLPTTKIKPKPIQPIPNGKVSLFDGLEDEEPNLRDDTFVPRRSVKKLVLKQRSTTETLLMTSSISSAISRALDAELSSNIPIEKSPVRNHISTSKANSLPTTPLTIDITERCRPTSVVDSVLGPIQKKNTSPEESFENSISQAVHAPKTSLNSSLDDTFEALHTRGLKHTGKGLGISFNSDANESDRDTSQTLADNEQNKEDNVSNIPDTSHPTGIVLKRYGYYTIPSLDEMIPMIDEDKNCFVKNFAIGREGYGKVSFPGLTNVAGLNLDEIVHFRSKEITIYPDDDNKPQIGEGLNRKAEVTLDCVWPVDKTNHTVIKDPERLQLMGYKERIEKATARLDAKFIDYRPETGSWVFQVQHFSKYGLEDSDEECEETKTMSQLPKAKVVATSSQPLQALQVINGPVTFTPTSTSHSQPQKASRLPAMDEDDEMEDITIQGYPKELERLEKETRLISDEENYTPARQLVAALGVNAQRIQGMKASFFQEEMEEDTWAIPVDAEMKKNCAIHMTQQKTAEKLGRPFPKRQATADSPHYEYSKNRSPYDHLKEGLTSVRLSSPALLIEQAKHPIRTPSAITTARTELLSTYPVISTVTVPYVTAAVQTSISGVSRKVILKPLAQSLCYNKQKQIADVGYFMGRKFRPGWGPNWTVLHLGPAIGNSPPRKSGICTSKAYLQENVNGERIKREVGLKKTSVFSILSQSNSTPVQATPFEISIEKVQMTPYIPADNIMEENLEQSLKVQLQHSASTLEEGSPVFVPKPGTCSLHAHCKLSQKHLTDIDPKHTDAGFVKQCNHVWELCVSLWGDIPGTDKGQNVSSYTQQMARREALSKWLVKTTKDKIQREINNISYDNKGYLSNIFNHLTGRQISDACLLAQESHDHRLALLLAQAGANPIVRRLVSKQLVNWEHCKADELINSKRLKIYSLLAGALVWDSSGSKINCCENLDWKRSLALHLWYQCSPCSSIQDAVMEYDKAFQGTSPYGQYTQPPYPPYLEKEPDFFLEMSVSPGDQNLALYDTCYHLLKLYCDRSHRLDKLLIPSTSTPVHLDHRLSWLLHQTLISLGYHHLPQNITCALHCNFASQLETMGMWHWAVYILLHITDPERRRMCVKELLLRHVSINQDQKTKDKENFLQDQLMVPKEWIFEAKAIKAHSLGQPADEAWYLLKAGSWNKSHNIIIAHLAADAIINENFEYLSNFLNELAPIDRNSTILDWTSGGQVFLDYIHISQMVNSVVKGDVSAYDLEKLQPEVVSLCYRLSSLRCPTARDRLCQSEMSKKTATLLRAVLTLQQERSDTAAPTYMLTPHINNLPMPEDYALQELRVMAYSYLLALTSE